MCQQSCHDRLLKGLSKLTDIPTYVIPLRLPHAMCVDTDFDVPHLFAAMEHAYRKSDMNALLRVNALAVRLERAAG